jgi:hypothetical protein
MSFKVQSFSFLIVFVILATITSNFMWIYFQWRIIPHLLLILSVAAIGENLVSSQGYYHYTKQGTNGPFVRNMPLWIIFLWVFCVQASLLVPLLLGLGGFPAILASGILAFSVDFLFFEPYMSRRKELWRWTSVENGYFEFIPSRLNRFTAPPGNYITWFVFPIVANCFLGFLTILI